MIYKIKITEKAGEISKVVEIETDDLYFAKEFLNEDVEITPEYKNKEEMRKNIEQIFKEIDNKSAKPYAPYPHFGGIEYWLNQPKCLGSGDILVVTTNE